MEQLLNELSALAKDFSKTEHEAMIAVQQFGFEGLKRLAECGSDEAHCINLHNDKYMVDNEMTPENAPVSTAKYMPTNIRMHMETYFDKLRTYKHRMCEINAKIGAKVGIPYCYGEKLYCTIYYAYHKYFRTLKLFRLSNWNPETMLRWDRQLHEVIKKKQEDGYK